MLRRLAASLLFLVSAIAFATTTVPVQLLNPTSSVSGQAIVSTGPSSAPAWGSISSGSIGGTTQYNVAVGTGSGLGYIGPGVSGTLLASTGASAYPQFESLSTLGICGVSGCTFTGLITPSSTVGIKGTTAADNAQAGSDGEHPSSFSNATSMTSVTATNCASLPLTAGDWEVSGVVTFIPAASTTVSNILAGIGTTSATLPSSNIGAYTQIQATFTAGANQALQISNVRINVSSSTTAYLIGYASFGTSTMTCNGFMKARRVR